ncbi:MAG: cysteine desulfurase [Clostridia bacterium]|nr:cysteine desulfurase [Clostridia bacterium]
MCRKGVRQTEAYFDNSATTKPCAEAIDAAAKAMSEIWGNPSSLHRHGMKADSLLELSRERIAAKLTCSPDEIYFTSGGTESNNTALCGAARKLRKQGSRIVSTVIEHPSVYETLSELEREGFEVIRLGVDGEGKIREDELFEAVNEKTILVSIMAVNNETGAIQPVQAAKRAITRAHSPALVHCDAVQAFGKMPLKPSSLGADLMSISAHKIHGIKGAGALYIRKGVKIAPLVFGGEQENKLRPGTQAMPAIAAFGAAAKALPDIEKEFEKAKELRDYMLALFSETGGIEINSPSDALPFITNISVIGRRSEPMLSFLSEKGVYVSSGSACSKGKKSRVLAEMGLSPERLESPLRISFSRFTAKEEIDCLAEAIKQGVEYIRPSK